MTRNPMFLRHMSCKISYLCILCQSSQFESPCCLQYLLFPWIFKICISFLKRFLLELFIMLHVICLTSENKFATYKIATIKMCLF